MALAWIFYGGAIVGLGALFLSLIYRKTLFSFSCCFWIGLGLLVTALQVINLFSGINLLVVRWICLLGLFFFWLFRGRLDVSYWPRLKVWHKLLFALAILWIADRALGGPYVYDSGLYHFNSVRWANEQPLPPGLGNLHGRLALNQSYFLFVSFVNLLPKRGDGHNFANSLLLVFTIITVLEKGSETTRDRARKAVLLMLGPVVFFFALLFNHTNEPGIASPSPDIAMLCLQVAMFCLALAMSEKHSQEGKERQAVELVGILLLSGLAVTFKLSSIVFSAGVATFAVVVCLLTPERKAVFLSPLLTLLVLGFTWLTRSVIASGYIIFPIVATACPVSWRLPPAQVRDEANWILSWPREPGVPWSKVLADWSWLWPWFNRIMGRPDFILMLCLSGFAGLLLTILFVMSPEGTMKGLRRCNHFFSLGMVCTAAFCFWFLTAPDPRFLGAISVLLPLCLLGIGLEVTESDLGFLLCVTTSIAVLGFGIHLGLSANGLGLLGLEKKRIGSSIPVAEVAQKITNSGLRVWVPVNGDQTWDAPLPATPYFQPDLQLRGEYLASGFCLRTFP
jgi:hypothetical protein